MPFILADRDTESTERMDDPNCDLRELHNTYRQFNTINSLISGWHYIYKKYMKPRFNESGQPNTLLDIGFGGGDIPVKLAEWSAADNLDLQITAIDPDKRAFDFARKLNHPKNITFLNCSITGLDPATQKFDFVISNHVLHHLSRQQMDEMLNLAKKLSKKTVIFNDGRRSDAAYLLFNIFSRPVFCSSFITQDGLISIKRSYTFEELRNKIPNNWTVKRMFPFRLLLKFEHAV